MPRPKIQKKTQHYEIIAISLYVFQSKKRSKIIRNSTHSYPITIYEGDANGNSDNEMDGDDYKDIDKGNDNHSYKKNLILFCGLEYLLQFFLYLVYNCAAVRTPQKIQCKVLTSCNRAISPEFLKVAIMH